ncbi:MAG: molybdopterin converting factor subunit 1 [Candidatus Latescibacteria bacterium]|jgi:molybdopterin synthase catalytic subunit|nr:molybdopterin converting factor subunit 1 [Candidatus Latescibacterota bacterium]
MKVKVLFFASCREVIGNREREVELDPGNTVADLVRQLSSQHPRFGEMAASVMVSVNQDYVDSGRELVDGDEIAFIPPVSGGSSACSGM